MRCPHRRSEKNELRWQMNNQHYDIQMMVLMEGLIFVEGIGSSSSIVVVAVVVAVVMQRLEYIQ